ncbi:hypothetical protein H4219_005045 [Mycoemilia scoparia]|uniref:Uncharacterized protein n=1 Tax=Mycoemilia scoparia TaxID=417184 RepID=A0A9W7ZPF5_9FUNG|nr:hypothetical protein H4219_005045 [Mycoemilia scoparia]
MIQHTQTHTRNGTQPLASTITNCGANGNGRGRTRRANFRSISDPANTHIRRFKSALGIRLAEYCLLPTSNPLYSSLTLRPILSPHFANGSSGCPPAASASGVAATPTISVSSSKGLNSGVPMAAATTTTTSSTAAANSAASISVSPESSCDKGTHINRRRPSIEGCQQHQHYPHIKDTIIVNSSNYVATNTSDPPSSMAVDDHPPGSKKRRRQRKDSGFAVPDDEQRCSAYEQDNATPASSGSFGNDSINNIPVSAQSAAFGATPGSAGHSSVPTAGVNSEDGIIAAHYHNSAATFATNPAYSGGGGPPRRSYSQHQTQTVTQAPQLLHRNTFPARLNLSLSENGCSDVRNNGSNTSTGFDYHYGGGAAAYSNSTKSHNKPFNCLPESPISPQWENCIWSSSRSPPLSAPAYVTQYPQPPPLSYMHTSKDSCQTAHNTSSIHPHQYHHHYSHHDPVEAKKNWCPKYQRPMVGQQQGECQTTATGGAPTTTTNTAGPLWTISPIRYK